MALAVVTHLDVTPAFGGVTGAVAVTLYLGSDVKDGAQPARVPVALASSDSTSGVKTKTATAVRAAAASVANASGGAGVTVAANKVYQPSLITS